MTVERYLGAEAMVQFVLLHVARAEETAPTAGMAALECLNKVFADCRT